MDNSNASALMKLMSESSRALLNTEMPFVDKKMAKDMNYLLSIIERGVGKEIVENDKTPGKKHMFRFYENGDILYQQVINGSLFYAAPKVINEKEMSTNRKAARVYELFLKAKARYESEAVDVDS